MTALLVATAADATVRVPYANRVMTQSLAPIISEINTTVPIVKNHDSLIRLVAINRVVNESLTYDPTKRDWRKPSELKGAVKGNCKDYVVLKMAALRRAGFSLDHMEVVIVTLPSGELHSVLLVNAEDKTWVLDNRVPLVRSMAHAKGYKPLISYSTHGSYLYGEMIDKD
jgi:predicted transglutaminase-like cysteine proteinase